MSKSRKYEIHSVKLYQAISFSKKVENFFSNSKAWKNPVEIEVNMEIGGVEIKDGRDHVIVPFNNVAAINLWSEIQKTREEERLGAGNYKTGINTDLEIKRPR